MTIEPGGAASLRLTLLDRDEDELLLSIDGSLDARIVTVGPRLPGE